MLIHVVEKGDTLWSIAQQYGVSIDRIIQDNGMIGQPYLVVGQALLILFPKVIHRVRQGDTVYSIAHQHGINVVSLVEKNPRLAMDRRLREGQEIVLEYYGEASRQMTTNGYAYPFVRDNIILQSLPVMTNLTIFGYGFTEQGELIPPNDRRLLELAYIYNAAPVLLLSSVTEDGTFSSERASKLFQDEMLQNRVIDKLIREMNQKNYMGIDIDFEFVRPEDGDAFLSFLQNVTTKMHQNGFFVNIDLAPKTSGEQQGLLYEAHDYAAIGQIPDTVLLMTYEWGYTFGPPMAVAPLNKVREVVEYAVTEIPIEKIMLGVPNYGYDWPLPYERGKTRAMTIGNEQAIQIAVRYGATIQFDEEAQSPFFEYYAEDGVAHIVWFEDARSILAKLRLANEFNLRGVGYWNLMRPFSQNWALLGNFVDVEKLI